MSERPYVVVSCAMSIDGYLDDASDDRLLLSSAEDFAQVDVERSAADAVLVGANTVRRDNPRLLVRDPGLIADRLRRGLPPSPVKVALSTSGDLDPAAPFFTAGDVEKIVYVAADHVTAARARLGDVATIVDSGSGLPVVLADLKARGVRRLLVEGGSSVLTQLFAQDLVDELHISIAPIFVGDSAAPRFVGDGRFPASVGGRRMTVAGVARLGDCVRVRYLLTDGADDDER